jgi:hypothetical protein
LKNSYKPNFDPPDSYDDDTEICEHDVDDDTGLCIEDCGLMTIDEYEQDIEDRKGDFAIDQYIQDRGY